MARGAAAAMVTPSGCTPRTHGGEQHRASAGQRLPVRGSAGGRPGGTHATSARSPGGSPASGAGSPPASGASGLDSTPSTTDPTGSTGPAAPPVPVGGAPEPGVRRTELAGARAAHPHRPHAPEKEYPFGLSTVTASRGQEGRHLRRPSSRSRGESALPAEQALFQGWFPHANQYAGGTRHRLRPPGPRARRTARHLVACRPLPRPCGRGLLHPPVRTGHVDAPAPRTVSASSPAPTGFADRVAPGFDDHGPLHRTDLEHLGPLHGPSLISDYDGTPTPYGIGLRDHPRALDS